MSYSRWGSSFWYTYWSASGGTNKEEKIFEICDVSRNMRFSYREIKKDMQSCLDKVRSEFAKEKEVEYLVDVFDPSKGSETVRFKSLVLEESLLEELGEYMKKFVTDVEKTYETRYKI